MLYLVHGEDEFRRSEWLAEIRQTVALDAAIAALNTVVLDGRRLTAEELEAACGATPFLADKRLVIMEGLAARAEPRQGKAEGSRRAPRRDVDTRLLAYLAAVPSTTDVVLCEDVAIAPANPFRKAVQEAGGRVVELQPPKPDSQELRRWVTQRARARGAQISPEAVEQLAAFVGNNLRLLDQEIAKLAAYADGKVLAAEDVRRLVSYAREASVFEMGDALGRRDARRALSEISELLGEGDSPTHLVYMVARHVRLLMQAREALDRGVSHHKLVDELGVHRFVAQKVGEQARNFSFRELQALYDELVQLDWAVKTGRMEAAPALDLLVFAIAGR